jgi:hypothetical protein
MTFDSEIHWDGEQLTVWAATHAGRVLCEARRDTIHCLSIYNDVVSWEIDRYKCDIIERLKHGFFTKISAGGIISDGALLIARLDPEDLQENDGEE